MIHSSRRSRRLLAVMAVVLAALAAALPALAVLTADVSITDYSYARCRFAEIVTITADYDISGGDLYLNGEIRNLTRGTDTGVFTGSPFAITGTGTGTLLIPFPEGTRRGDLIEIEAALAHASIYDKEAIDTVRFRCGLAPLPLPLGPDLADGSLNANNYARPVAIYPGSYEIWGIHPATGNGAFALEISDALIAEVGVPADAPALLAEGVNPYTGAPIMVFRLPSGEFQLNTFYVGGKPYVVSWNAGDTFVTYLAW